MAATRDYLFCGILEISRYPVKIQYTNKTCTRFILTSISRFIDLFWWKSLVVMFWNFCFDRKTKLHLSKAET